jgi:hypothetical protein
MSETRPIVPENTDGTEKNRNGTGAKRKTRKPRLRGNRNNPNFAELGRPYRWRKGQPSPNPGGRPKTHPLTEALRELLEFVHLKDGLTVAQKLAEAQVCLALGGSVQHFHEIANRVEGPPTQTFQQEVEGFYEAPPGEERVNEIYGRIMRIAVARSEIYNLPMPEVVQEAQAELKREKALGNGVDGETPDRDGTE